MHAGERLTVLKFPCHDTVNRSKQSTKFTCLVNQFLKFYIPEKNLDIHNKQLLLCILGDVTFCDKFFFEIQSLFLSKFILVLFNKN